VRREITQGSILKNLVSLSWPIVLAMAMHTSYNLVDIFWVGKLGPTPIAAVSLAGVAFFIVLAIAQTLGSGTVALVARAYGARKYAQAGQVVGQSLTLTALVALAISATGTAFSPHIMALLGGRGEVLILGSQYLRIAFVGFFFHLLGFNINYAFRGTGDMITPMLIMLVATVLNIVLDPLLILGIGFFPRLGVEGAALATLIAKFCGFLIAWFFLIRGRAGLKLPIRYSFRLESTMVKTLLGIGIPVGISYGLMTLSWMAIFRIVASFGPHVLAALGISMRVVQMASLPIVGIGIATTTLVGQNLGATKKKRALRTAVEAMAFSTVVMVLAGLLFFSQAGNLIGVFSSSEGVIAEGARLLRIVCLYLVFVGLTITMAGVFRGSGDTRPPMFAGLIKLILLILLALVFSRLLSTGVKGVWWAMVFSYGLETLILWLWFRKGKWQEKRIEIIDR
jgi:putative MATE family efflux protein